MYDLQPMNHLALSLEAKVLVELMESWRRNKATMLQIEKEVGFSRPDFRRPNTYKANRCRKEAVEMLLKEMSVPAVAEILDISDAAVYNH